MVCRIEHINHVIFAFRCRWGGLTDSEQDALKNDGWNPDVWKDAIGGPGVTPADPLHDPAVWIVSIFLAGRIGPITLTAIEEYLCFDGNCGNEIEVSDHVLQRMAQRGVSIDQLQEALQLEPFRYFHDGTWKLGYYDPINRILVAVAEMGNIVTTVITNVKPQYIEF